ncbi:hypothetical protein ACHAWF_004832 [Thalassiosira exigua]
MDAERCYCKALGFKEELTRTKEGNVHFSTLCCCKGHVSGISDYSLSPQPEHLCTAYEEDPLSKHFLDMPGRITMVWPCHLLHWRREIGGKQEPTKRNPCLLPKSRSVDTTGWYKAQMRTSIFLRAGRFNIKNTYEIVLFKQLHGIIINVGNKYIQSYIGVKDYVKRHLKNKVWDVILSLHANESADERI